MITGRAKKRDSNAECHPNVQSAQTAPYGGHRNGSSAFVPAFYSVCIPTRLTQDGLCSQPEQQKGKTNEDMLFPHFPGDVPDRSQAGKHSLAKISEYVAGVGGNSKGPLGGGMATSPGVWKHCCTANLGRFFPRSRKPQENLMRSAYEAASSLTICPFILALSALSSSSSSEDLARVFHVTSFYLKIVQLWIVL